MRTSVLFSTLAATLLLAAPAAHALFKVVGPDGRVTARWFFLAPEPT